MKIADYLSEHQFKQLGQIANKSRMYEKKMKWKISLLDPKSPIDIDY